MNRNIFLFIPVFFANTLFANTTFSIASYNIQNFFDLHYDKKEYQEYIPNTKARWNKKTFNKKLTNISTVIRDLNADILAIEEIESKRVLDSINNIFHYKYSYIAKNQYSTTSVAILSKYKIAQIKLLAPRNKKYKNFRSTLRVKVYIKAYPFYIYINHWPSKRHPESYRIAFAKEVLRDMLSLDEPYVILGDLNSRHNEIKYIKRSRKSNDSKNKTAINSILPTTYKKLFKTYLYTTKMIQNDKYKVCNLWSEVPRKKRWNYIYRKHKQTLDHMIISSSLVDKKGIDYVQKSFHTFKRKYLFKNNKIYKWQMHYDWKNKENSYHLGKGYSDHLPITAKFILYEY